LIPFGPALEDLLPVETYPTPFTVLTYIPDNRWEFYDGPTIYQAARALPNIRFEVLGGTGAKVEQTLPNLVFFGWQSNVRTFLNRASVLVRLVRHDGFGGTVKEALNAGLHVIYSQAMPHVHVVPYQDPAHLEATLSELLKRFEEGNLIPNHAGHDFVQKTFNLDMCLSNYLHDFRQHLDASVALGNSKA
jgi:hypothetical protein